MNAFEMDGRCQICYLKYSGFTLVVGKCRECNKSTQSTMIKFCGNCAYEKCICIVCGGNIKCDPVVLYEEFQKLILGKSENYIGFVTEKYENIVNGIKINNGGYTNCS